MSFDTVLLLDPDVALLRSVKRSLDAAGYDVRTGDSIDDAITLLDGEPFGVVVAATDLPRFKEDDLVGYVATHDPHMECVLLAERSEATHLADLYDRGNVFNHVWKPMEDIGELARAIARALERRALRRQNAYLLTELRDARDEARQQAEFLIQVERLAALGVILTDCAGVMQHALVTAARASHDAGSEVPGAIRRAIDDCTTLVRQVQDFAVSADEEPQEVAMARIVEETVALVRPSIEARGVSLALDLPDDGLQVTAVPSRLRQALAHVTSNAILAMPEGGTLSITADRSPFGSSVRIQIADCGPGISPDDLPRIFEPFFTTRPLGAGTGLGLAITRTIIREHEGDIHVESARGRGTVFTITLPTTAATGRVEREPAQSAAG